MYALCVRAVPFFFLFIYRCQNKKNASKSLKNKEFLYFDLDVEKYKTTEKIGGYDGQ